MKKEQSFFIQLISDHLNDRITNVAYEQLNWDEILCYAHNHQVSGIVYYQYKDNVPLKYAEILKREMLGTMCFQASRENELEHTQILFKDASIPFFIVKGPIVADLYPNPGLRSMGDIDIIVHVEDREECHNILLRNGFTCVYKEEEREWAYFKNNIEFELHGHLVNKSINVKDCEVMFFDTCWDYIVDEQLVWNFHLLYLLFHIKKHMLNYGVGFRQFMDLAVVAQKKVLNWQWIKSKLEEMEMLLFAQTCYGFIERWFGIKTPIAIEIDDEFFEKTTEHIFSNGVFGFDNTDNYDNILINRVRKRKNIIFQMTVISIKKTFPSMKTMKNIGMYKYLDRLPLLLPIAWVHRWFKILQLKGLRGVEKGIGSAFTSKEQVIQRERYLKKWGL